MPFSKPWDSSLLYSLVPMFPSIHSSDFFLGGGFPGVPAPSLTALDGILSAPCSALSFSRQLAALHLGEIPLTSWETSFSSLVPAFNILSMNLDKTCIKMCDRWVQISSVAGAPWHPNLSHWLTHGHYNFPTSLVGFSLPSTVGVSSSWFGFGFYFLYHNQKQKSPHPFS